MDRTLVQLAEQFKEREIRLRTSSVLLDSQQIEGLVLQMHEDLAEFMQLAVTWMQVREQLEVVRGLLR